MLQLILVASGLGLFGLAAWLVVRQVRRSAHTRDRIAAWKSYVEAAPEPPPGRGTVHALCPPPGPAGELEVRTDGVILRLKMAPDRNVWVPWSHVQLVEPSPEGVRVWMNERLRVCVSSAAGRDLYNAETAHLESNLSGERLSPVV